jgi:1-acyl-sn-glycerol-3-phosphate acyltransferase
MSTAQSETGSPARPVDRLGGRTVSGTGGTELPTTRGAAVGRLIGTAVARGGWRVRILGEWRVPAQGPVILAANHSNFLDGPLLLGAAPRPVHFLIKREFFRFPLGLLLNGVGQIPISRDSADRAAITQALGVLEGGGAVGVFPEGTRSAGGNFEQVRGGLTYLALRSGAPVVPVAVFGTGSRGSSILSLPRFRGRIDVVFGEPFQAGDGSGRRTRTALREAGERVQQRLADHLLRARGMLGIDDEPAAQAG